MAVFSTNQNRQLYVVYKYSAATGAEVTDLGDLAWGSMGKQFYFKYAGHGGPMRTDLIDKDKIKWITYTQGSKDVTKLKTATIKLADAALDEGKPITGQDYIVRIYIHNYLAPGDAHTTIKYGAVHVTKSMDTPEKFYTKLAESLTQNFSREVAPLLTFTASEDGVKVEEVKQPWQPGTMSQETVNFDIMPATVTVDGDEVYWCVVDEKTGKVEVKYDGEEITNGKRMADLEYFCMGERGDQYRNVGWPNVIPTKYMIDPEGSYNTLTIHYAFSDSGVNVQNSEKDITFVGPSSAIDSIRDTLGNQNLPID